MIVGTLKKFLETKEDCRTIQIYYNGSYHDFTMADIALGIEHLEKDEEQKGYFNDKKTN